MAYLGYQPPDRFNAAHLKETFTGNNSAGPYVLSNEVANGHATHVEIFIGNVRQEPGVAYSIGGTGGNRNKEVTFTGTVPSGEAIYVVHKGEKTATPIPPVASLDNTHLKASSAIDATKIANGNVSNAEYQYLDGVTSSIPTQINNIDVSTHTDPLTFDQESTPSNPASNKHKLYFKNDGNVYKLDSAGNEKLVGDTEGVKTNAADIFTNFVKDMENHGRDALHTETGFVDELETAGDMVDASASSGITYTGTPNSTNGDNYYSNTAGATNQTADIQTYTQESYYKCQEWTNTNTSTSQITIASSTDSNAKLLLNCNGSNNGTTFTDAVGTHTVTAVGNAVTKTSDSLPGSDESGSASYSSNNSGGTIANMVNNNTGSSWSPTAGGAMPQYWVADFGSGNQKTIKTLRLNLAGDEGRGKATSWTFAGSNDNSSYTTLITKTSYTFQEGQTWDSDFDLSNSTAYRYYKFNMTASQYNAGLPTHYEIELIGEGTAVSPKFGTAMAKFDGSGDYLTVPTHSSLRLGSGGDGTGVYTIEAWVAVSDADTGSWQTIYSVRDSDSDKIVLEINGSGSSLRYIVETAGSSNINKTETISPTLGANTGTFYHVRVTRDSSNNVHMYINGSEIGSGTSHTAAVPDMASTTHQIGANNTSGVFKGWMDDFRISNSDRTATAPTAELSYTTTTATISSGTFPTNALNSRITMDGGSTWRDVTARDSNTALTLASYPSNGAYNWAIRMDEFSGGKVKLNDVGGTNLIGETVSIAPAFAQLTNCSQWSAIDDMTSTETANSQIIRHFIIHGPSGMTAYNDTDTVVSTFIPGAGADQIYPYTTETNYTQQEWTNANTGASTGTFTNGSATVNLSSGSWPTNALNARISQDGTNWYDITTRNSNTQITLGSNFGQSTVTGNWTIRMSEFDSGAVKLNARSGANVITEYVSTFPAFAQLKPLSGVTSINSAAVTDTEETGGHTFTATGNAKIKTSGAVTGSDLSSASSLSSNNSGGTIANMINNNTGSNWSPSQSGSFPQYWVADFGSGNQRTIKTLRLNLDGDEARAKATSWTFAGSNDNSSYTTLLTKTSYTFQSGQTWDSDFDFSNSTAYRYYKFNMTASQHGQALPTHYEIELCGGTIYQTDSATITSSQHASGTINDLRVDNSSGANFNNADSTPVYINYDLGSGNGIAASRYFLKMADSASNSGNQDPYAWTFDGSNDNSSWTTLDTETAVNWTINFESKEFEFTNSTSYRYYRIKITDQGTDGTSGGSANLNLKSFRVGVATTISPKFGNGMLDVGTGGDNYISAADSNDWNLDGNFAIDFWMNHRTLVSSGNILLQFADSSNYNHLSLSGTTDLEWKVRTGGANHWAQASSSLGLSAGTWYHVALVRSGSNIYAYVAGNQIFTSAVNNGNPANIAGTMKLGGDVSAAASGEMNGWIDEFRFSNVDRGWTGSTITVPSSVYSTDSNTKLLLHMDGSNNSTTFTDESFEGKGPYYAFIFGPTGMSAYNDTDTKVSIFNQTGSVWKQAIQYTSSGNKWQYNSNAAHTTAVTWTDATVNDINHALSQAVSTNAALSMLETDVEAITQAEMAQAGGPMESSANNTKVGIAGVLRSSSSSQPLAIGETKVNTTSSSTWKKIAKYTGSAWQYNNDTASTNAENWVNATVNDMNHAVSQAVNVSNSVAGDLNATKLTDMVTADWALSGGFVSGTTTKIGIGNILKSTSNSQNPEVDKIATQYDQAAAAIDLRTKQWTGSGGTPAAPGSAPGTIYLFVVDEQTSGTPTYAVTRNGGTNWTNVTFDTSWTFSGTKTARRAAIDVTGQGSGTDPRLKITNASNHSYKIHAIGLQTRS